MLPRNQNKNIGIKDFDRFFSIIAHRPVLRLEIRGYQCVAWTHRILPLCRSLPMAPFFKSFSGLNRDRKTLTSTAGPAAPVLSGYTSTGYLGLLSHVLSACSAHHLVTGTFLTRAIRQNARREKKFTPALAVTQPCTSEAWNSSRLGSNITIHTLLSEILPVDVIFGLNRYGWKRWCPDLRTTTEIIMFLSELRRPASWACSTMCSEDPRSVDTSTEVCLSCFTAHVDWVCRKFWTGLL